MQNYLIFLLILMGLALLARPLTVLFHELGHAIAIILLTKQKATIYIGSYGDPQRSIKINLGVLQIFFRYNPFAWRLGLCVPSAKTISISKSIVYTLAGPLASIIIATISCYFAFAYDLHGFLKLFLIVFFGSALLDLLVNLIPNNIPIELYDGSIVYNDGYNLKQLLNYKHLPKKYSKAADLYEEQKFADAAVLFEQLLDNIEDERIFSLAINSYLQDKNYKKVKELGDKFLLTGKMNADDFSIVALSYSQLELHDQALELYDKSLQLNPDNEYSLCNKGYTLTLMNKFEEAIALFDRAIELDKDSAFSYANRGLAKIKLGLTVEGLQDIKHSSDLDQNNAYSYKNLGIYHFDRGEFDKALQLFISAKELDNMTHMIDELLQATKNLLVEGKQPTNMD